jgi:uncharacterized RDD family membrane protein YckC
VIGNSGTKLASQIEVASDLRPATDGAGPLLQRDYWAVFADGPTTPSELMTYVKSNFCALPPAALVSFTAPDGVTLDAVLDIVITPGPRCGVRVVHEDAQSLTLATLMGHPEAGRITFGSYGNAAGEVIFHIRSRARSGTALQRVGFLAIGDAMQTNTWADVIRNTATSVNARIAGIIHADTQTVEETVEDEEPLRYPTFLAVGD